MAEVEHYSLLLSRCHEPRNRSGATVGALEDVQESGLMKAVSSATETGYNFHNGLSPSLQGRLSSIRVPKTFSEVWKRLILHQFPPLIVANQYQLQQDRWSIFDGGSKGEWFYKEFAVPDLVRSHDWTFLFYRYDFIFERRHRDDGGMKGSSEMLSLFGKLMPDSTPRPTYLPFSIITLSSAITDNDNDIAVRLSAYLLHVKRDSYDSQKIFSHSITVNFEAGPRFRISVLFNCKRLLHDLPH